MPINQEVPFELFKVWFSEAQAAGQPFFDAMTLATVTQEQKPSARIVLIKKFSEAGVMFVTNFESRKAIELASNPNGALVFHWDRLERQVRIEGVIHKGTSQESDDYWKSRPRGSQISAFASHQSQKLEDRDLLLKEVQRIDREFEGKEVPRPEFWGAYHLVPTSFEFWQGRPDRLHERTVFLKSNQKWEKQFLYP
jgi:pyridoxamine 5'-phosphate oxidase